MVEIEFSVMQGGPGESNYLLPLLEAFEKQYHIHVNLTGITWSTGWAEIAKFGIYGHGPDISAIGASWIGSLAAMQTLRPFTPQEVSTLGGADTFFESNWRTGLMPNDSTPWAVPWHGDALVIYYWKDALEKIGIPNLDTALSKDTTLVETLEKLQKRGCPYPLAITTTKKPGILQEAAYWIWSAGGDLVSPNGKRVIFNQPAALEGFKNYFSLRRFISPESLSATFATDSFLERKALLHIGGSWLGSVGRHLRPEWGEQLGIARAPGTVYVGGTSFVIWKYSSHTREAFELLRFLSCQPTQTAASPNDFEISTRRDAIHLPFVKNDIFYLTCLQALQNGRSFPTIRLWGSVEEKLVREISDIWTKLFADPDLDLDACLHRQLDPLAERLNMALEN